MKKDTIRKIRVFMAVVSILLLYVMSCGKNSESRIQLYLDLGERYLSEENYDGAVTAFTKVIELEPKTEQAYIGWAIALSKKDKGDEAVSVLQEGIIQIPDSRLIKSELDYSYPETVCSVRSGSYTGKVAIELYNKDNFDVYYRVDSQDQGAEPDILYTEPIVLNEDGEYILQYYSVNPKGNRGKKGVDTYQIDIPLPALSTEQAEIIVNIQQMIENSQYYNAAAQLGLNAGFIKELCAEMETIHTAIFDGREFTKNKDGYGIAFCIHQEEIGDDPTTGVCAFVGTFSNGVPQGNNIKAVKYETYDSQDIYYYTASPWNNSAANGTGQTGEYWPSKQDVNILTEGNFVNNRFNGEVKVTWFFEDGSEHRYEFKAENGRPVYDEKWQWDDQKEHYFLKSVVGNSTLSGGSFINFIHWTLERD